MSITEHSGGYSCREIIAEADVGLSLFCACRHAFFAQTANPRFALVLVLYNVCSKIAFFFFGQECRRPLVCCTFKRYLAARTIRYKQTSKFSLLRHVELKIGAQQAPNFRVVQRRSEIFTQAGEKKWKTCGGTRIMYYLVRAVRGRHSQRFDSQHIAFAAKMKNRGRKSHKRSVFSQR